VFIDLSILLFASQILLFQEPAMLSWAKLIFRCK